MTARRRASKLLPMALATGLATATPAFGAEWNVDSRWRAGVELADEGDRPQGTGVLGASFAVRRETESVSTRADASLDLRADGGRAGRRSAGRIALAQSLTLERDAFTAEASLSSEGLADAVLGSADVLLGRGDRRTRSVGLGWTHAFTERASGRLSASSSVNDYARTTAQVSDYAERSASASLSYALDERSTITVAASRSAFSTEDERTRSSSDSLRASGTWQWSEAVSATASIGTWRSMRSLAVEAFVCPLPVSYCSSGIVDYVLVRRTAVLRSSGSSYAAGVDAALDERTSLAARLTRDLQTGGAGVQRIDTASLGLRRTLSSTIDGSLGLAQERSSAVAGGGTATSRQSMSLGIGRALSPDSRLAFTVDHRRTAAGTGAGASRSTRLALVYESAGPRLDR